MNKILLSILAGIIVAGSASAVPSADARRKACEQQSDKMWVEKTQACIPVNPCKSGDFTIKDAYCVDLFSDVQTHGELYMGLVELYAWAHNLQCVPVAQDAKKIGQDYVMCQGEDIKVFEFDDIQDANVFKSSDFYTNLASGLCEAVGGYFDPDDDFCKNTRREECDKIAETIKKYPLEFTNREQTFFKRYLTNTVYDESVAACKFVTEVDAPDANFRLD